MTWQVIAEKPRGEYGWPIKLDPVFDAYRAKVEKGTHIMCSRFIERPNPITGEFDQIEQRVVKQCRVPLQPCEYWSAPTSTAEHKAAMANG